MSNHHYMLATSGPAQYYSPENPKPPKRQKQLTIEEAKHCPPDNPVRLYADGIFDLFHFGHSRALMQAKILFPNVYLIVGVCNDELTHAKKGMTVMNEEERYMSVLHCRYVDEVVKDAPWNIDENFIEEHQIDFVTHDNIPYAAPGTVDLYADLKAKGMFIPIDRTEYISTSDLITRIVRDYDVFVRRNLFRGYSRDELNIGYFSEKRIRINAKIMGLKKRLDYIEEMTDNLIKKWEEKSHQIVTDFISLFIGDGRIATMINEGKSIVKEILMLNEPESDPENLDGEYLDNEGIYDKF